MMVEVRTVRGRIRVDGGNQYSEMGGLGLMVEVSTVRRRIMVDGGS